MSQEFGFRELKQLIILALACGIGMVLVDVTANSLGYNIKIPIFHEIGNQTESTISSLLRSLRILIERNR